LPTCQACLRRRSPASKAAGRPEANTSLQIADSSWCRGSEWLDRQDWHLAAFQSEPTYAFSLPRQRARYRQGIAGTSRRRALLFGGKQDDLPHDEKRVWVDRYDYRFSAGNGHAQWEVREKNALPFNEGFFKAIGSNPHDCKLVVCHGRSMEPFLFDKDMIMVDTKKVVLREEKIYALWLEDEPLVKQVFKQPGGGLVLHSYNPAYPDKLIEADQLDRLKIFGQCVYRSGAGFL
jgi:hypothetical protein